ncbi:MAG: hypothetical protein ROZ09_04660 [Thiobacillus sp.]|jgi:hypothetical protein|uniref:hypothetical protein n=1 Tax=Thiobacillus sp. TaxID=924 RepID=UPI0028954CDC|nr:hypothetical protein [Thiobacillus sp.]MDT3706093.1 hypothetical protein [Thiobacillus sp.]
MNAAKLAAIVMIAAGTLGLVYGGFSYTKDTHQGKLGPMEFAVEDRETVAVPVWLSVGTITVGMGFLLVGCRKN